MITREFKFNVRYAYRYQQQVVRMRCARKKHEDMGFLFRG